MKKLTRGLHWSGPPVLLYQEDVKSIYDLLARVFPADRIYISAGDYVLDSPDELLQLEDSPLRRLQMSVYIQGLFSVSIEGSNTSLYCENDAPALRGTLDKIRELLLKRRRPLAAFVLQYWYLFIVMCLVPPLLPVLTKGLSPGIRIAIGLTFLVLFVLVAAIGAYYWFFVLRPGAKAGCIIPRHVVPTTSFFKRNKDAILLMVLTAIVTAVITALATIGIERLLSFKQSDEKEKRPPNRQAAGSQSGVTSPASEPTGPPVLSPGLGGGK